MWEDPIVKETRAARNCSRNSKAILTRCGYTFRRFRSSIETASSLGNGSQLSKTAKVNVTPAKVMFPIAK
jgi:hypothetical protein